MALASSYLEGNDYGVLKYAPYKLNVNDIAKTLAVKTHYWNLGAQRVKERYSQATGLDVSNPENKRILTNYIAESENNIKKLSEQDLSNPDVQEQGIGMFKALFSDEGIMYDNLYTKYTKNVYATYEHLLKTDPEKANETNLEYAMEGYQEFIKNPDRNSAKSYYQNRRSYTPFYDPTKEINSILKNCKANERSEKGPKYNTVLGADGKEQISQTGYSEITSVSDLTSSKIRECFDAGLSEQAKNQIRINGIMAFKSSNPELDAIKKQGLADLVFKNNQSSIISLNKELVELETEILKLQNKEKSGTITDNEKNVLQNYRDISKQYVSEIDNIKTFNGKLAKGDMSEIIKNYDAYATSAFFNLKLSKFGNAFSYTKFSRSLEDDPVQTLNFRQAFEAEENRKKREHDKAMLDEEYKYKSALKMYEQLTGKNGTAVGDGLRAEIREDGTIEYVPSGKILPSYNEDAVNNSNPYGEFLTEVSTTKNTLLSHSKQLAKNLYNSNYINRELPVPASTIMEIKKDNPGIDIPENPTYGDLLKLAGEGKIILSIEDSYLKQVVVNIGEQENYNLLSGMADALTLQGILNERGKMVESQIPEEEKVKYKTVGNVEFSPNKESNTITVTPDDIYSAINDGENKAGLKISKNAVGKIDGFSIGNVSYGFDNSQGKMYVYEKSPYALGPVETTHQPVRDLGNKIIEVSKLTNKLNKKRRELYGDKIWKQSNFHEIATNDEGTATNTVLDRINNKLADSGVKEKAQILGTDFMGSILITLPFNTENYSNADLQRGISDALGGLQNTELLRGKPEVEAVGGNKYIIRGLASFDKASELGLTKTNVQTGTYLNKISNNLKEGDEQKVPIQIPTNNRYLIDQEAYIVVKKSSIGTIYKLYINDELKRENQSAFALMKEVQALQQKNIRQ